MHTPLRKSHFHFWSKITRNALKRMRNQFSYFCDFYFLSYDRFCSQFSRFFNNQKWEKRMSQKMHNVLKRIFEFIFARFLVFEFWSILYFTVVVHSGLRWIQIFFMLGMLCAQTPDAFGLNPTSQPFITFLAFPQFTTTVENKIDHIS